MSRSNVKYFFFIILLMPSGLVAQTEEPYAEILNTHEDYCEQTGDVSYELEIRFYGEAPFGLTYKTPKGTTLVNEPIQTEDLSGDNVWTNNFTITLDVEDTQSNTGTIELTEVFDKNHGDLNDGKWVQGTGEDITDQETTVTNWAMPSPDAGDPIDSCGLAAVLDASPDPISDDFYWETPDEGTISDTEDINATFEASSIGVYSLVFTQENGACLASDQTEVNLIGAPSGNITTSSEVCGTESQEVTLELSLSGDGPWDYGISDGSSVVIENSSSSETTNETTEVNGETTFSLEWLRDNNGCLAREDDISAEATVVDNEPDTYAGEDQTICGMDAHLEAVPDKGTGEWSTSAEDVTISDPADPESPVTAENAGDYVLTWTENNNGCENSDDVEITFISPPTLTFQKNRDTICQGDETSFEFEITENNGPWTIEYESNGEPGSSEFESASSALVVAPETSTLYSNFSIIDQHGCSSENNEELSLTVDRMPEPFAGKDTAVCDHEITLEAVMSDIAESGEWQSDNGVFSDPSNPESNFEATDHSSPVFGEYMLTWRETNGLCTAEDQVSIRFDRLPEPEAGDDKTLYHQYKASLNAKEPVAGEGNWRLQSGQASVSDPTNPNTEISGLKHGETILEWTVINGVCPPMTDTLTITVNDLTYHTGMSPNNDGINDHFRIKGAHTIPNNELIIFDQNGQVIYRRKNLGEENAWDGKRMDGSEVKEGIYYFIFKGEGIDTVRDYLVIKRN